MAVPPDDRGHSNTREARFPKPKLDRAVMNGAERIAGQTDGSTTKKGGAISQPIATTPAEAARLSALIANYEVISDRLHTECEGLAQEHPHQWAGMNSDQQLILADTLTELLEILRPAGDRERTVAVLYLGPSRPRWSCDHRLRLLQSETTDEDPRDVARTENPVHQRAPATMVSTRRQNGRRFTLQSGSLLSSSRTVETGGRCAT